MTFLWTVVYNIFMRQTLTDDIWGLHKNMNCAFLLNYYADDNNLFTTGTDIQLMSQMLLSDFRTVNNWFHENFMI